MPKLVLEVTYEQVKILYKLGFIDRKIMKELDALCKPRLIKVKCEIEKE